MPAELRLTGAVFTAFAIVLLATPVAVTAACRLDFYDRPAGYKKHGSPTPYLGGTAVMAGVLFAGLFFGGGFGRYAPILIGSVGLWMVGTLDDRTLLGPAPRVLAAALAATLLSATGLGWEFFGSGVANHALTVLWIVGIVNAFNLMDNLDGASSTVASVSAAGVGVIAIAQENFEIAALAAGLSTGCWAFLRFNLAKPARIFLGDGGSMPIGFLVAAIAIQGPGKVDGEWSPLLIAAMLVGLVIFDTCLVILSRLRRDVPVLSGGRDHITHRIFGRVGSTRRVALVLAGIQGSLCCLALVATLSDNWMLVLLIAVSCMVIGAGGLALSEMAYARSDAGRSVVGGDREAVDSVAALSEAGIRSTTP